MYLSIYLPRGGFSCGIGVTVKPGTRRGVLFLWDSDSDSGVIKLLRTPDSASDSGPKFRLPTLRLIV